MRVEQPTHTKGRGYLNNIFKHHKANHPTTTHPKKKTPQKNVYHTRRGLAPTTVRDWVLFASPHVEIVYAAVVVRSSLGYGVQQSRRLEARQSYRRTHLCHGHFDRWASHQLTSSTHHHRPTALLSFSERAKRQIESLMRIALATESMNIFASDRVFTVASGSIRDLIERHASLLWT